MGRAPRPQSPRPDRFGERVGLAAAALLTLDQALVFEQLQRRVDRAGARPPNATSALVEFLDHLVPVHRTLREEREDRRAHVAATTAATVPTMDSWSAKAWTWTES